MIPAKPRIGLLALYWGMFDPIMPPGYRQEKETLVEQAAAILARLGEVVHPGLVTDEATGAIAARAFHSRVDVAVVFACMATPPAFGWSALAGLGETPVVFWNAHLLRSIPADFSAADIVAHSSNVGTVMLTNVLLREGRRFRTLTGRWDDPTLAERVVSAAHAGAAAARLRRARLGVLGDVLPGYLDVMVDREALKRDLGLELLEIPEWELTEEFLAVKEDQEQRALTQIQTWTVEGVSETDQRSSARLAVALERIVRKYDLDGGALNCHTPYFMKNPSLGIVACYAVSRLLDQGVPFTCTGDIPTAVAGLILKFLGASAQYCECDVIDYDEDYMLLSNTGEGDPGIAASSESIRVVTSEQFRKGGGCGACLRFPFRPGPGTLVSFSPKKSARGNYSLVVAGGTILDKHFPRIGAPNAGFRFKSGDTVKAFERWCLGGSTHHAIAASGDHVEALCDVALFLGIESWVI